MRTFAVSMALLVAGLVGGGYGAYRIATAPAQEGKTAASAPRGGENQPAAGGSAQPEPGQAGAPEKGQGGASASGRQAQAQAGSRGDRQPGQGSVSQANRESASAPSSNQSSGIVSGGEAQAQSESVRGDAAHGQTLFTANCQGCHGNKGQGVVGPALIGADRPANWQFADFRNAVLNGRSPSGRMYNTTMPRYKASPLQPKGQPASDQDLADLQAYLKTIK